MARAGRLGEASGSMFRPEGGVGGIAGTTPGPEVPRYELADQGFDFTPAITPGDDGSASSDTQTFGSMYDWRITN